MKIKTFITSFVALIAAIAVQAQVRLTATLIDASNGSGVAYATVSLTKTGAKSPSNYVLSTSEGVVLIENIKPGEYTFKVELLGYETVSQALKVGKENIDLGKLKMKVDSKTLDAASVSAVGNPIVIKKDTIEYSATSFKTTDNDALEDLLKKLPGVEVSEDGSVTVNGETVKKITIDGKTFFLDDPQLATKNIPAKIVNKVKVVEKKSDQSLFSGIDDGEHETVIDLNIKPGMMKGLFGNTMAGLGHDMPSTDASYDDYRYQGAAFTGYFTDKTQISVILNANNTNNRGFNDLSGSMMGGMRGGGGPMGGGQGGWGSRNGITTSYMGGTNIAGTFFDGDMEAGGNYLYNASRKDVIENSDKTTYLDDHNLVYHSEGVSNTNSYGHRMGVRLEHKFSENTAIIFEPRVNFGTGDFSDCSATETSYDYLDGNPLKDMNSAVSNTSGANRNWSAGGFLLFRQKLGDKGRNITVMTNLDFSNNDLFGMNQSLTSSFDTGTQIDSITNQRYESNQRRSSVFSRMTYTEPIGENFFLEASYNYSYSRSESFKDTWDSGSNAGFRADNMVYTGSGEIFNPIYSNNILNVQNAQQMGLVLLYQKEGLYAQAGFSANPTDTHNETTKSGIRQKYDSNVWRWAPRAMFFYDMSENCNARLFYYGRSSQPSTSQLMPVPDNTNPLNVSFGNPSLKPYFSHDLRSDFRYNNRETFTSVNARLGGGFVQSPIVNAIWYGDNGAQYNMPFNGPTSTNLNLNVFVNSPIAKSDFSVFNMLFANASKNSSYVGTDVPIADYYDGGELDYDAFLRDFADIENSGCFKRNTTRSLSVMERLRFTYRTDALEVRAGGRTRMSKSWYTISEGSSTTTWSNQVDFDATWTWDAAGITIKGDLDYNWYEGYSLQNRDDEWDIDFEINKLLFEKKLTLGLKGYDLLGQTKNLTVTDNANYHTESMNNTLGRYIIFSLTYRFGTNNRNSQGGGHYGGPHGGPRH